MKTRYKKYSDGSVTMTMNFTPTGSFLEQEEQIAEMVNEAGKLALPLSPQQKNSLPYPTTIHHSDILLMHQRKLKIDVETDRISRALLEAIGTNSELPIRFLYELRINPTESLLSVRRRLGVTERTASRWIALYREVGFDAYVKRPWKRQPISGDLLQETEVSRPSDENILSLAHLMELLREAPLSPYESEWGKEMQAWLRRLLPEVDRVGVNIANTLDLFSPCTDPDDVTYTTIGRSSVESDSSELLGGETGESDDRPEWVQAYLMARDIKAFEFESYHPPQGFDYYYHYDGGRDYLGSLILLRSAEKSPLTRELLAPLLQIEPLIIRMMAEAAARFQVRNPRLLLFADVLDIVDPDRRLSTREREVTLLHLTGESREEISRILHIDETTVASHTKKILSKLKLTSVKSMVAKAFSAKTMWRERKEEE